MLWLALSIPALPLALRERAGPLSGPLAITERQALLAVNRAALAAGARPGMGIAAAQALAPELRLQPRDLAAEARAREQLAAWALQFTPWVSLQPPDGLLLEIEGSLRLFGGLQTLLQRLREQLQTLGYTAVLAVAPTPEGAWLLGRGGDQRPALDLAALRRQLAALPCSVLEPARQQAQALTGLGIHTVGDYLRLPRGGRARRLGRELLERLDRALGERPDPRRAYLPAARFHSGLELPAPVSDSEALLFVLRRLLVELAGFLRGLDAGTQRLSIRLGGADGAADQELPLGCLSPTRDPDHLLRLARERLARTPLQAPVLAIALLSDDIQPFTPAADDLFSEPQPQQDLLERFYARLGESAVHGLQPLAEHRPEQAWRYAAPGSPAPAVAPLPRPLWLLPEPQPLRQQQGRPCCRGPLVLQQGPERIESGWWDGGDISRDYYIARNPDGERLWVFRERRGERRWYLHGLFA